MRIGFYAPLKAPSHPRPSGDRKIGRLLIKALKALGHEVEIISDLRSWEGDGCQESQDKIRRASMLIVKKLLEKYSTGPAPELIFTYHVYHKAPDWIGIKIANALNIPYVIAEASFAPKQLNGPWQSGHQQTLRCIRQAEQIIAFNPADIECIKPLLDHEQKIDWLKPFLDELPLCPVNIHKTGNDSANSQAPGHLNNLKNNTVRLIAVAMMREGDKEASYKQLSEALKKLDAANWQLIIIGDGNAAAEIKRFYKDLEDRCLFTGELANPEIFNYLLLSDIFVWPAVNEALGLALLEAQACGLPAVVQNYGGVATIIEDKVTGYVTNPGNIEQFISALDSLIINKQARKQMSLAARHKFESEHSFGVALKPLDSILNRLTLSEQTRNRS